MVESLLLRVWATSIPCDRVRVEAGLFLGAGALCVVYATLFWVPGEKGSNVSSCHTRASLGIRLSGTRPGPVSQEAGVGEGFGNGVFVHVGSSYMHTRVTVASIR